MHATHLYTPIVKGKLNDIKALGALWNDVRAVTKPLVEAMPCPSIELVEPNLIKLAGYLSKYVPNVDMYVDFYGLSGVTTASGQDATIAGFKILKAKGLPVTPTYGFQRNDGIWSELKKITSKFGRGFCFRIDVDDLDDQTEDSWAQILERSAELGLRPNQVDIIVDLRDIGGRQLNEVRELSLDFLGMIPTGTYYRSITIAGSAALKTVTEVPSDGVDAISRKELRLWSDLARDLPDSLSLVFGDYGVVHPDFSDQGFFLNQNAKVRYTAGSRYFYFRGHKLLGDYEQYRKLARKVQQSGVYMGSGFSDGDAYIDNVVKLQTTHGSPATWVFADMNHHMQYTARQLISLGSSVRAAGSDEAAAQLLEAVTL